MSRKAFEALINEMWKGRLGDRDYSKQRSGNTYDAYGGNSWLNKGWLIWQAATEHTQQWTPYKEGDVVEDGSYLVSVDGRDWVAIIYHDRGKWVGDNNLWWIDNSHVTAYRPLPPAFNGDAV